MLYLLDTNIVSYLMKGNKKVAQNLTNCLAIGNKAVLVTNNTQHLSRLQDIVIENWTE